MKIKIALCFFALSGCSLNTPLGPQLTTEQKEAYEREEHQISGKQFADDTFLPSYSQYPESNMILDHKNSNDFYRWAALKGYKKAYFILAEQYLAMSPVNEADALYWLNKGVVDKDVACTMRLAQYYALEKTPARYTDAQSLLKELVEQEYLPAIKMATHIAKLTGDQALHLSYLNQARKLGDIDAEHQLQSFVTSDRLSLLKDDHDNDESNSYQEIEDLQGFWEQSRSSKKKHIDSSSALNLPQLISESQEDDALKELVELAHSQKSEYASLILAHQTFENGFRHDGDRDRYKQMLDSSLNVTSGKTLYARSIFRGMVDETNEKALSLLNEAAQLQDPYALFVLSLHSRFVKKDFAQATKYYYKALALDSSSKGQYQAALDLYQEYLPFSNIKIASEWFIDLAYENYPPALLQVAQLKEENKILSQSVREIFLHRAKAAYLGSPEACYLVGNMYLKGQGVDKDLKKSFLWVMHAARAGYVPAQYQLSLMYKNGEGVIEDPVKSYAWFTLVPEVFEQQQLIEHEMLESMSSTQLAKALETSKVLKKFYHHQVKSLS